MSSTSKHVQPARVLWRCSAQTLALKRVIGFSKPGGEEHADAQGAAGHRAPPRGSQGCALLMTSTSNRLGFVGAVAHRLGLFSEKFDRQARGHQSPGAASPGARLCCSCQARPTGSGSLALQRTDLGPEKSYRFQQTPGRRRGACGSAQLEGCQKAVKVVSSRGPGCAAGRVGINVGAPGVLCRAPVKRKDSDRPLRTMATDALVSGCERPAWKGM